MTTTVTWVEEMQELSPVFEGDVEHDDGSDDTAKVEVGDCLTNWKLRG